MDAGSPISPSMHLICAKLTPSHRLSFCDLQGLNSRSRFNVDGLWKCATSRPLSAGVKLVACKDG
eukprot:scaffold67160_cov28-Tisochrysis_lutea.AAC.9